MDTRATTDATSSAEDVVIQSYPSLDAWLKEKNAQPPNQGVTGQDDLLSIALLNDGGKVVTIHTRIIVR